MNREKPSYPIEEPQEERGKKRTNEDKPPIQVVTRPGYPLTEEEIEERKELREEIQREREIRQKLEKGESLSPDEVNFLLELERKRTEARFRAPETEEEKKTEEAKKETKLEDALKEVEKARKEYGEAYLDATRGMKKRELKAFREIRTKSEQEIKDRIKGLIGAKPEEVGEKRKEFLEFLKGKFKERGIEISDETAEKILEVELKKLAYDERRIEWVRAMKDSGEKDSQIIMELAKEAEILRRLEIERWPPEKKSLFVKILSGWMKLPRGTRLFISATVLTGLGILFPNLFPATAALCAKYGVLGALGFRVGRGLFSMGIAQAVGSGFERFFGTQRIEREKEKSLQKLAQSGLSLENLDKVDQEMQRILDETAKTTRKAKLTKALLMVATTLGASVAFSAVAEALVPYFPKEELTPEAKVSQPEVLQKEGLTPETKEPIPETIHKETLPEITYKGPVPEFLQKEKVFGIETVEKGESPLSEAKKIYMEHAKELGYKGNIEDIEALKKWAEIASARHIVGQYIREHPEEFKSLIEKIGYPPEDPIELDEWLHKVPKSIFNDVLYNKVPNLVYTGDRIVVTEKGDIYAISSKGELRLGHIPEVAKTVPEAKPGVEVPVGKKLEALAELTPAEKQRYFEHLFFEDTRDFSERIKDLAEKINKGELTIEDFGRYYTSKLEIETLPPEVRSELNEFYRILTVGTAEQKQKALMHVLEVIAKDFQRGYFEHLIYKDPRPLEERLEELASRIQRGSITMEDFGRYYVNELGLETFPPHTRETLNEFYRILTIGTSEQKQKALLHVLKVMIKDLQEGKTPQVLVPTGEKITEGTIPSAELPKTEEIPQMVQPKPETFENVVPTREAFGSVKEYLNYLVYSDRRPIDQIINDLIKNITPEEFGGYYGERFGAEKLTPELQENLRKLFEDTQNPDPEVSSKALRSLRFILYYFRIGIEPSSF